MLDALPGPQRPRRRRAAGRLVAAVGPQVSSPADDLAESPTFQAAVAAADPPTPAPPGSTTRRRRAADHRADGAQARRDRRAGRGDLPRRRPGRPHDTIRTYAVVALLALLLITALAGWQSGRLLAPLRTLRETAEEISDTDLSRRLPETRQRRHHRADPHRQRDARPARGGVRRAAPVPRRRRPRAQDPAHRAARPPRAARRRATRRRSPRPGRCCSTRSTGCRGWSAT